MSGGSSESGRLAAALISGVVLVSAALFAAGLGIYFARGGAVHPFRVNSVLQLFAHAFRGVREGTARGFVEAGLIVLLVGPFVRLGAAVLRCSAGRDWRFIVLGIAVAALMVTGILLGTGG